MATSKRNLPEANILMNSMRAMGYTFESAVADVIDNSICAGAQNIKILMPLSPLEKDVCIFDDGSGMSPAELMEAMKYGSNVPDRKSNDLGRFGLGLKSASLSQCRKLTVVSKKDNIVSALQWDLDFVEKKKDWVVKELSEAEIQSLPHIDHIADIKHGTGVIWSDFDTLDTTRGSIYTCLNKQIQPLCTHLSLIFHRFLQGEETEKINIFINFHELVPLDPFLHRHKKTRINKEISIPVIDSNGQEQMIRAQTFNLPHLHDLSPEDQKLLGGIESMKTQQGFYVYRGLRLIIWGSWFGMPREEIFKYARVKVDIPNTLDDIWHIDIKKQNATIPRKIRDRLKNAVLEVTQQSQKKITYRGSKAPMEKRLWFPVNNRGISEFRINRDSSLFGLLSGADEKSRKYFDLILDEIEKSIPYNDIYNEMAQHGNSPADLPMDEDRLASIECLVQMLLKSEMEAGATDRKVVLEKIFSDEPFRSFPELYEKLLGE